MYLQLVFFLIVEETQVNKPVNREFLKVPYVESTF